MANGRVGQLGRCDLPRSGCMITDVAVTGAQAEMLELRDPEQIPIYRRDLAPAHHLGFGFHAEACAPGILALLAPVRARGGLVLELGCGSGLLTRELTSAGHRVVAADASPAMLQLARGYAPQADLRQLTLPLTLCQSPMQWYRSGTYSATSQISRPSSRPSPQSSELSGRPGSSQS